MMSNRNRIGLLIIFLTALVPCLGKAQGVVLQESFEGKAIVMGAGESKVNLSIYSEAAKKLYRELKKSKSLRVMYARNAAGVPGIRIHAVGPISCQEILNFDSYSCSVDLDNGTPVEQ